jgi:N4-gp56 family major capsid protein
MGQSVTIDALRQELWSKELLADTMRDVENIMRFAGTDVNNVVQIKRELKKEKGDIQTFGMVGRLSGNGVTGDNELEGNEEAQKSFSEQVAIDQIRNAVRLTGKLDAQKVVYSQIEEARNGCKNWMTEFLARNIFFKMGGVTNTTLTNVHGKTVGTRCTWSNTPDYIPDADEAYTGARLRYMNVGGVTTASLSSSHTMTLDTVTAAATMAALSEPQIQRISGGKGEDFWVMYLHPLQARDLRKSSDWKTAQENARMRGEDNPVFRGALGYWSNVLLLENEFVPWLDVSVALNSFRAAASGTDCAVDAARALLCGRGAVIMAEASNSDALVLETFDYKNIEGVACSFIGGIQKPVFSAGGSAGTTAVEYGVIAVDSYAAV